ncbi:phage tail protein [Escherichia coli]|uniref:phage tail protein n=6 Tax=Escherichia TaxID=561 RepID=UPI000DE243EF|nr:phage tail protein [Escherichia coli]EEZ8656732.1 phage tail protein [Escherichia coli]ELO4895254.1 phage tail protein [Escherichia coli]MBA1783154.1 phage tail protein [Escherichia coli]HBU9772457.1 phage tail protein [Escherichia coli]
MTAKYFAILTNQGAARLANAAALGTKLNLTQMAVGDANGTLPTPEPAQTKLINQKRIAPLNLLTVDPANTSQIIAEQIIPENEGGFWIREIGLYDDDGILIAVANCPETYKPQLQEGSGRTQTIRMILIVSSTSAITLKIDPAVVLATRQYVDDKVIEVKGYADDLMKKHVEAANPHKQYPLIANALKEMVDAGLVGDVLKNLGLGEAATRNVGTDTGQVPDMSSFTTGHSGAADWPNPKSGWSKGPDGVITQWGIFGFPVGQTGTNVVFPLPFPARVESITLTMADIQESLLSPATMPAYGVNSTGTSRTGFTARMSGAGGFNLCYIAKGR